MPGLAAHEEIFAGFVAGCAVRAVPSLVLVVVVIVVAVGPSRPQTAVHFFALSTLLVGRRARLKQN
jgi:hypothetical protein